MKGYGIRSPDARTPRRRLTVLAILAFLLLALLLWSARSDASTAYEAEEFAFLRLINDYRQENGLRPLVLSDTLTVAAERHSQDMARYDFFAHNTAQSSFYPTGSRPWDRMEAEGYTYNTAKGENLAVGYETAAQAMTAWQESPSHNAAMLEDDYKVVGISRLNVPGSTHGWYWTTDFGGEVDPTSHAPRKRPDPGEIPARRAGQPAPFKPAPPAREPAADTGALENGGLGATGVWTQRATDGVDLVTDEGHARLGGYHEGEDELRQKVRVGQRAALAYDVKVRAGTQNSDDRLVVRVTDGKGRPLAVLDKYTDEDKTGWSRRRADLSRLAGRAVFLSFHAKTDTKSLTTFYVDDISLRR